ncbi:MAG: sigma-54 dependent transcriptional regulator [Nitrospinota bacterium]|nr:sigma-54 dependent transcriptional regulator [Nitrospinota bacterium]
MIKEPIVIVDDDKSIGKTLKLHFERQGHSVVTAITGQQGLAELDKVDSAIVILDVKLPDANGVELLKEIQAKGEGFYSIIITAFPDMETTVKAVQNGVGEYIHKPIDIEEMDRAIGKAQEFFQSKRHEEALFESVPVYNDTKRQFIGKSFAMKEVFKMVGHLSLSATAVHISGESGTGKELVAQAIHYNSQEKNNPFVSVNCSAIVDTLLESELFGHEKGSFTGAIVQKQGKFAQAGKGTMFLDEIGEMDVNLQAKLLRVLQEREFERVGGKEKIKCECRIISATNKDLRQLIAEGGFREDLYYRLNVVNLHIPPLRERVEDIPELVKYFIAKANHQTNKNIKFISQGAARFLTEQNWKGNVRELENFVTQAVIMTHGDRLTESFLRSVSRIDDSRPSRSGAADISSTGDHSGNGAYQPKSLCDVEKEQIQGALDFTKWHKGKTCEILGITRPRLDRKIRKYGIKQSSYHLQEQWTAGQANVPQVARPAWTS